MLSRRSFVKSSIFVAGAASLGITEITYAASEETCHWALLSDTHLPADITEEYRGFSMVRNMEDIVLAVAEVKPIGIAITGDIARLNGLPGDYVTVKEYVDLLSQTAPVFMALGNHDNFKNFNAAFPATAGKKMSVRGKHVTVVNSGPMRFIFLDSLQITNYTAGLLGMAQRRWLKKYLNEQDKRPTVIFFHHTLGEGDGNMQDDLRFLDVVQSQRHVKACIFGHSHAYRCSKQGDLDMINLPSTAYTFGKSNPVGWVDAQFTAAGVTLKLNAVAGSKANDGKVTEIKWRT